MLTVNEIFHSIQGESTRAGEPCVFVSLTACDLRCSWCDTPYAFHEGSKRSVEAVADEVGRYGCPLVEITGGEPLLQEDVYALMEQLIARGHRVMIETGGHRSIARIPRGVRRIVDVKCPGSGEGGSFRLANLDALMPRDEVKFVLADRRTLVRDSRDYGPVPRASVRSIALRVLSAGDHDSARQAKLP